MAGTKGLGVHDEATYGSVSHKDKMSLMVRYESQPLMVYGSITKAEAGLSANKGDTIYLPKAQHISESTTTIPEFSALPVKEAPINEVAVTVDEYGAAVEYTGRAKTYAEINLEEVMRERIAENIARSKDTIIGTEFANTDTWLVPTASGHLFDDDAASPDSAADQNVDASVFRSAKKKMRQDNVPMFDGRFYLAIMSAGAYYQLFEDTATGGYQDIHKYAQPENLIRGETGEYFGFRIVEETHVLSDTIGTSSFEGEMLFVGGDAVAEAVVMPETVKMDTWEYERFLGIAWYGYFGWKQIWNQTDDSEYRVIRVSDNT